MVHESQALQQLQLQRLADELLWQCLHTIMQYNARLPSEMVQPSGSHLPPGAAAWAAKDERMGPGHGLGYLCWCASLVPLSMHPPKCSVRYNLFDMEEELLGFEGTDNEFCGSGGGIADLTPSSTQSPIQACGSIPLNSKFGTNHSHVRRNAISQEGPGSGEDRGDERFVMEAANWRETAWRA